MEGNRHFPPSHTEYMIMDDVSPVNPKERNPTFSVPIASPPKKEDDVDYSASNEESSVEFIEDESPGYSSKKVFFPKEDGDEEKGSEDKGWKNDAVSIPDLEEHCPYTTKNSIKFVNGLPTVVKKSTSHKFHCIQCHYEGNTKVDYKISRSLAIIMAILFLTLFWPCLAYVAFSKEWKDLIHSCPNCGRIVGKRRLTNDRFHS